MKKTISILFILLFLSVCTQLFAQKMFKVDYESQADIKVYVVSYESQADLNVYMVKYESQANKDGLWYNVAYESQADFKLYFVDYESQVGWKNKQKEYLLKFKNK